MLAGQKQGCFHRQAFLIFWQCLIFAPAISAGMSRCTAVYTRCLCLQMISTECELAPLLAHMSSCFQAQSRQQQQQQQHHGRFFLRSSLEELAAAAQALHKVARHPCCQQGGHPLQPWSWCQAGSAPTLPQNSGSTGAHSGCQSRTEQQTPCSCPAGFPCWLSGLSSCCRVSEMPMTFAELLLQLPDRSLWAC